jgi:N-acetylmuramoyl-L-alanine amidase
MPLAQKERTFLQNLLFRTCLVFFSIIVSAHAGKITALTIDNKNNIIFTLEDYQTHTYFYLSSPDRLVVDLRDMRNKVNVNRITPNNIVKKIRVGYPKPGITRFVFEMQEKCSISMQKTLLGNTTILKFAYCENPTVPGRSGYPPPHGRDSDVVQLNRYQNEPRNINASIIKNLTRPRIITIVIDPGHGGKDPGASGYNQTVEKDLVLNIAKKLQNRINASPNMHAILTRNNDTFVKLRTRMRIARKNSAHLFLAIHADAFDDSKTRGASIFALSEQGATSEAAHWLAEKENHAALGGVDFSSFDDQNVKTVLLDLAQTASIQESLSVGKDILRNLSRVTKLHNRHIEQARFMVLKSPDTPSLLIETGFISNNSDAKLLASQDYQQILADAIFQGIKDYFTKHPPVGINNAY